jgi:hypothetical protein
MALTVPSRIRDPETLRIQASGAAFRVAMTCGFTPIFSLREHVRVAGESLPKGETSIGRASWHQNQPRRSPMLKPLVAACALLASACSVGLAQDLTHGRSVSVGDGNTRASGGHVSATGKTMPKPGASQGEGTTPLDRGIQRRDELITNGICKGC